MFKFIFSILGLIAGYSVIAKSNSDYRLTSQDISYFSVEDQMRIKTAFPDLITGDAAKGAALVATIGPSGCDFNSAMTTTPIQDALNAAAVYTELRIVEGSYDEEGIILNNRAVKIKGGYANCSDAASDTLSSFESVATVIESSTDNGPVFIIQGNASNDYIAFSNLTIQNSGSSNENGGAIQVNNSDGGLALRTVALIGNTGENGGAIAVVGAQGVPYIALNKVQISDNSATEGGGIYCSHPNGNITQNVSNGETHGIFDNTAIAGDGGGVLIENGCQFTSYQGSQDIDTTGSERRGINFNTATGNGGGVAIRSGAKASLYGRNSCALIGTDYICLFGNNTEPMSLFFNQADHDDNGSGDGGAIYVTGIGSELLAENVDLTLNRAYSGGGVAANAGATALLTTAFGNEFEAISCWQPGACLDVNSNLGKALGGGFYVSTGAVLTVGNAQVRANRAIKGIAGYVNGSSSELNFEGSVFYDNGDNGSGDYSDQYLFRAFDSAQLRISYSTVANNQPTTRLIDGFNSYVALSNSIIYDPNGVDIFSESGSNAAHFADCLVVHENQSFGGITRELVGDPLFVDSGNNDYRLTDSSPAIDRCDQQWITAVYPDMLGQARGFDAPGINDTYGPYEAGAYEKVSTDVIFKDGFE